MYFRLLPPEQPNPVSLVVILFASREIIYLFLELFVFRRTRVHVAPGSAQYRYIKCVSIDTAKQRLAMGWTVR